MKRNTERNEKRLPKRTGNAFFALTVCLAGAVFALSAFPSPAAAKLIDTFEAWSAFVEAEDGKKVCYIGSEPLKERGDYTKRGETYILVTHRPADKTRGVVSVRAGYTYKEKSEVQINIGSQRFTLFTKNDHAWAYNAKDDQKLVAAMRAGIEMIVTGLSNRGTKTTDTYSLSGFTAAHNAINKACPK